MREQWADAFTDRARAWWTPERLHDLAGDRRLPLSPDRAPLVLRALGLLNGDASMPPDRVRKWRQINHMVVVLGPTLRALAPADGVVRIVDAGCGRSYLTMALAHVLRDRDGRDVRVLGLDRDPTVIEASARRAEVAGVADRTRYCVADLDDVDPAGVWASAWGAPLDRLDLVVALHACDTATDAALALAVRTEAAAIAVAPCCQAELAARWATSAAGGAFAAVHRSAHLRRHAAATVTDTMRLLALRARGYEASAIEFVASEHTPKNTLLRAHRAADAEGERDVARVELASLVEATGGERIGLLDALGLSGPDGTSSARR